MRVEAGGEVARVSLEKWTAYENIWPQNNFCLPGLCVHAAAAHAHSLVGSSQVTEPHR